jgi:signal transduction histidine kinase
LQLTAPARNALGLALATVLAWLFLVIWRRDRTQPALAWWGAAHAVCALSMVMFTLRGTIAAPIVITLANVGLALGQGLIWAGARRFSGLEVTCHGVLAGGAIWLLASFLPGFFDALSLRVALSSLIILAYEIGAALAFYQGMRRQRLASHRAVIGVLLALATLHAFRIGCALLLPLGSSGPAAPESGWEILLTILWLALVCCLAVLLVALALERAAFASNAVLTASRDAAASSSREKTRFLARMSHELRTPLNGVLGMAQALAQDPALGPEHRERAATLERAGRHLLAIVNDVLDLTRIEAGRLELSPRPIRLRQWLAEALDLVRGAAAGKRIALRLEVAPEVPEAVLADPVRLRQILLNLLGNAVKFTPEAGRVALLATWTPEGVLRLTVTDTGPGVPPELRGSLFGEFNQGPRESAAGEGTGLGLAISAALARAMGGTLAYAPGPGGCGSVFGATLPLPATLPRDEAAPVPTAPRPAPSRPLRLLVVDDVRPNRLVARALLEPEGHLVEEAADGRAAIEALRDGARPDAVLMDVGMPGLDGYATTALIRRLEGPVAGVPVIALTAYAMPEDVAASQAAGMDGHLAKPLERAALLAELARVLPTR